MKPGRIASLLLCALLLYTLLPNVAFATEVITGDRAIMPGVTGIESPTAVTGGSKTHYIPNDYIYFGKNNGSAPIKWRVLGLNGNGGTYKDGEETVAGDKAMFLLSEYLLADSIQFSTNNTNTWAGSNAQSWCKDFAGEEGAQTQVANAFTADELAAILATSKKETFDGGTKKLFGLVWKGSELSGDKVFFLSADELASKVGNYDKAQGLKATFGENGAAEMWWLRSPYANIDIAGVVYTFGFVTTTTWGTTGRRGPLLT